MGYRPLTEEKMPSWRRSKTSWTEMEHLDGRDHRDVDFGSPRRYRSRTGYVLASIGHALARHLRYVFLVIGLAVTLTVFIIHVTKRPHHAPFVAPESSNLIVHGARVEGLPEPTVPLKPFPYSPMRGGYYEGGEWTTDLAGKGEDRERPPWLAAVISAAWDLDRRMLIRSSWMRLYRDLPFDTRFVICSPPPQWIDAVRLENSTFGDMIILDHLQEDDVTANTIKTIEMYQWLIDHDQQYDFVSKMDTDVFFNARGFYDRFLRPRLSNSTIVGSPSSSGSSHSRLHATVDRTVIGELYYSHVYDLVFPHGAMYTFTWDMVETLAALQREYQVVTGEDMTLAMLLLKAHHVVKFINFRGTEKFDYDPRDTRGDGTAWARKSTHPNAIKHAVHGDEAIVVHDLKTDDNYLVVADCFDEDGIKPEPPIVDGSRLESTPFSLRWHDFWSSLGMSKRYQTRFGRVVEFLWTKVDGTWRCDGIWDMGESREGFQ